MPAITYEMFARTLVLAVVCATVAADISDAPTPTPTATPTAEPTLVPTGCPKCHWTELSYGPCSVTCGADADNGVRTTRRTLTLPSANDWDSATCGDRQEACNTFDLHAHGTGTVHDGATVAVDNVQPVAGMQQNAMVQCDASPACPIDCVLGAWGAWGHPTERVFATPLNSHDGSDSFATPSAHTSGNDIWGNAISTNTLQMERIRSIVAEEDEGGKACPDEVDRIQSKPWVDHCASTLGEVHSIGNCGACVDNAKTCEHIAQRCSETAYSRVKIQYSKKVAC